MVKIDYIKLGLIKSKCAKCGYTDIQALQVHHIDRNRKNNNLDNLQVLCCNCHRLEHYEEMLHLKKKYKI